MHAPPLSLITAIARNWSHCFCLPTKRSILQILGGKIFLKGNIDHIIPLFKTSNCIQNKIQVLHMAHKALSDPSVGQPFPSVLVTFFTSLTLFFIFLQFLTLFSFFNSPNMFFTQGLCTCCFPGMDSLSQFFTWHSGINLREAFPDLLSATVPLKPHSLSTSLFCFLCNDYCNLNLSCLLVNRFISSTPAFLRPPTLCPNIHTKIKAHFPALSLVSRTQ